MKGEEPMALEEHLSETAVYEDVDLKVRKYSSTILNLITFWIPRWNLDAHLNSSHLTQSLVNMNTSCKVFKNTYIYRYKRLWPSAGWLN